MKMKHSLMFAAAALAGLSLLSGCGNSNKAEAKLDIKSGTYVLQEGKNVDTDEGYLALNIDMKNTSGKTIDGIYDGSFKLYDDKGNQISTESVYADGSDSKFKTLSMGNLAPDKDLVGYLVFQVDKGQKYELHYSPMPTSKDKPKDIVVKVDSSKYSDPTVNLKKMAQGYVDNVFLAKTSEVSGLSNDLKKAHNDFNSLFAKNFDKELNIDSYYQPSQAELDKVVTSFEAENAKRGTVEYTVSSMFPDYAVVKVSPSVLDFDDLNADSITTDWVNANEGKFDDYDAAMKAAAKNLIQNLPTKFSSITPSQPSTMSSGGEKLILTKGSDGKWKVNDTDSDSNYDFKQLQSDFMGGVSNY
ncbi:DUF4352 domain-containing protein [Lactococcus termiticola]|uniref:Putative lipoprotein YcdA n=1 Tax=Lactococcus termiticola TaxID=2169526 RepID=A0A2R5HEJ0_9LACT|nr:DUF4352 domain-containing protein [Lactococcus termiticola]GBG96483.1 putative lipoprotein YcdA [Lactococcus termiticola]